MMKNTLAAFAFSAAVLAFGPANAAPVITISAGPTGSFPVGENFNSMTVGSAPTNDSFATFSGGGVIAQGTQPFLNQAPTGDTSPYLSINNGQSETVTFKGTGNMFGLYWGSIDTYNTLTLTTTTGTYTITGSTLAALTPVTFGTTSDYVEITGIGTIESVNLASTLNSFESDNFELATVVPEASTWAMMLLGFASVGFLAYRKRQNNVAFRFV